MLLRDISHLLSAVKQRNTANAKLTLKVSQNQESIVFSFHLFIIVENITYDSGKLNHKLLVAALGAKKLMIYVQCYQLL